MSEVEKVIRTELGKLLKIDAMRMSEQMDLTQVAEWDSLSVLELLEMIEDKFNVQIPPEKLIDIRTIKDVIEAIEENN